MASSNETTVIDTILKGCEWRLLRLGGAAVQAYERVANGIRWRANAVAWKAFSSSVYRLALMRRPMMRTTLFIGITGSAGKTTTKDLLASILERHFPKGQKGEGTLNGPYDVARLVLRTRSSDAYCVTEIAITNEAGIDFPLSLFRPKVGVVTTIGGDHVAAYGSLDGVAEEKAKLIRSLPADGLAVLNADDSRVLAMRAGTSARVVTYGTSRDAMLRAEAITASWPERLSFTVSWQGECARVQTQLCGAHWVPVVMAALATAVAMGVPLATAAAAVFAVEPFEGRMSPAVLDDGVTFIRDDWKAPYWGIAPSFDFMRQARAARKVVVMGTISDYSGPYTPRYVRIAREALEIADCVVFVGPRASACLRARRGASDPLYAFPAIKNAAAFLGAYLRAGDLVLLKGSVRTDHLERLILSRTGSVACWRLACRRMYWCHECKSVQIPAEADGSASANEVQEEGSEEPLLEASTVSAKPDFVVIGLGNPGERYASTRHNIGQRAVDLLAERLGATWTELNGETQTGRARWEGLEILVVKPLARMNDLGPPLAKLVGATGAAPGACILLHDDLDLPLGTIRGRLRGGDGGHRGVRSVIEAFQDDRIARVKIGVGKPEPGQTVDDFVLQPFPPEQSMEVDAALAKAAGQVFRLIRDASRAPRSAPDSPSV